MKRQVYNPFLPLYEYIPDGEPHVFGDRIYLFGSHDREGGERYCEMGNYVGWSAPVNDLTDWKCEGVIYEAESDPTSYKGNDDLYAPDVVRGSDGRYYLYYGLSGPAGDGHNTPIKVAVCDEPAGRYTYLGFVKNPDGTPFLRYLPADPAVINDEGVIRLYYGWSLSLVAGAAHGATSADTDERPPVPAREQLLAAEKMLFKRTEEQLMAEEHDVMGANTIVLEDDMMTVKGEPERIVPGQFASEGTGFERHAFYEASSIRKINGTYYFIYSSENSHELCYATSEYPNKGFVYRGIIHSNGDVGYQGRKPKDRVNMTANNHGSLECILGQWYIFYHRQTHNTTFSRQACAEPVEIQPDGSIAQVECTSCGLNNGPLLADREYPAAIACNITNGHMPHATNRAVNADIPFVTHLGGERFITNIKAGTRIGFKYFIMEGSCRLVLKTRGTGNGIFRILMDGEMTGSAKIRPSESWMESDVVVVAEGRKALYLYYEGNGSADLLSVRFEKA